PVPPPGRLPADSPAGSPRRRALSQPDARAAQLIAPCGTGHSGAIRGCGPRVADRTTPTLGVHMFRRITSVGAIVGAIVLGVAGPVAAGQPSRAPGAPTRGDPRGQAAG